jgi:hypothetical protein
VWSDINLQTFRRILLPGGGSFETAAYFYQATRRHIPHTGIVGNCGGSNIGDSNSGSGNSVGAATAGAAIARAAITGEVIAGAAIAGAVYVARAGWLQQLDALQHGA